MLSDFVVNVAAGIFLSVAAWFLFTILQPRFLALRYHAPKLGGTWTYRDSDALDAPEVGSAEMKQSGERLHAVIRRVRSRSGKSISRTFVYRGNVRDGQVLLTFEDPVSGGFVRGSLTLKLSGDLRSLTGYTTYLDRDSGQVVSFPIHFQRIVS